MRRNTILVRNAKPGLTTRKATGSLQQQRLPRRALEKRFTRANTAGSERFVVTR